MSLADVIQINPRGIPKPFPRWLLVYVGRDHGTYRRMPYLLIAIKPKLPDHEGEIINGWRVWRIDWAPNWMVRRVEIITGISGFPIRFWRLHR